VEDTLLDVAFANWRARFCANGVDPSDLERLADVLDSWSTWCSAWSEIADEYERWGEHALAAGRVRSAGEALARAATYFHFAQFLFLEDADEAGRAHERAVSALTRALPLLDPPGSRHEIDFDGARLVGVLRTPGRPGPHPTVILVAGLDSTKEEFRAVETAFLDRGLATFALDGPGQGEGATLPARPDWAEVGQAVVEQLRALPEVDAARLGAWGVSLGGYYVVRLAAANPLVRAVVSLSGPFDLSTSFAGLNPLTRRFFEARTHSASPEAAAEAARGFALAGHARDLRAPLLAIAGTRDRLFPVDDARRLVAEAAGPSELLVIEGGNHGCANSVNLHRTLAADWVAERLEAG
jgi:dienelactone hydrolase